MSAQAAAPVALFTHRRLEHTRRVVESLLANEEAARTSLVVYSDGPRSSTEANEVAQVRQYLRTIDGFASVRIVERERNLGLAGSITAGVDEVLAEAGRVIVLEDDTVVAPHFLRYMNDGLELYRDDETVASIHGYVYPLDIELPETFFMRGADCWGWATWSRAWTHFEPDGAVLRDRLAASGQEDQWDHDGLAGLSSMLDAQVAGRVDSWAVRWTAAAFLDGMYTLYPGQSLVHNIGNDGSGRHGGLSNRYNVDVCRRPIHVERIAIEEDPRIHDAFTRFYAASREAGAVRSAARWVGRRIPSESRARVLALLPSSLRERLR